MPCLSRFPPAAFAHPPLETILSQLLLGGLHRRIAPTQKVTKVAASGIPASRQAVVGPREGTGAGDLDVVQDLRAEIRSSKEARAHTAWVFVWDSWLITALCPCAPRAKACDVDTPHGG